MTSILERLPSEILEQICKDVLICDLVDVTPNRNSPPRLTGNSSDGSDTSGRAEPDVRRCTGAAIPTELSALLHTCRQLYHEASRIFFSYNKFHIDVSEATLSEPARWLSSLPREGRSRIRNFTITYQAGNNDLFSELKRQSNAFDPTSLSLLVNAPRIIRDKNMRIISSALRELQSIDDFKFSAINIRFERQAAGSLEWDSCRRCWAQCLYEMNDTFKLPDGDEIGCDSCRKMGSASRCSYHCRKPLDSWATASSARPGGPI